jgi:hypothetical protein
MESVFLFVGCPIKSICWRKPLTPTRRKACNIGSLATPMGMQNEISAWAICFKGITNHLVCLGGQDRGLASVLHAYNTDAAEWPPNSCVFLAATTNRGEPSGRRQVFRQPKVV